MTNEDRALLCVDDEANILSSLKRLLRKEHYKLFTANNAQEGLELMKRENIQVVISDQRMPDITGVEFLKQVKKLYPSTVRVVLSGFGDLGTIVLAINQGEIYRFLTKPWCDETLKADIRQCFEHYDIVLENQQLIETIKDKNQRLQDMNKYLEHQIRERTQTLQMSQDVLDELPQPVLCISAEYQLIIANKAVIDKYPSLSFFLSGTPMDELLPATVCSKIKECIDDRLEYNGILSWNNVEVETKIKPLMTNGKYRGAIVVLV